MKNLHLLLLAIATAVAINLQAADMGSAFTYQGRLTDGGASASGNYDIHFDLRDAPTGGNSVGASNTVSSVSTSNGLFTVTLDFGANIFAGSARWLEIAVRANNNGTNANGNFSTLTPRQPLTPTPYALYTSSAGVASVANSVSASTIIQGQSLQIGVGNSLVGLYATITGGGSNTVSGSYAAIAGGFGNTAISNSAAIGGGSRNIASGDHALVAGGEGNSAMGDHAFVGGGAYNGASGYDGVGGGLSNSVSADYSWVSGGQNNRIFEISILGGVTGHHSFIGGGRDNSIRYPYAMIGGGANNSVNGGWSAISGGAGNAASSDYGVIGGGWHNTNQCAYGSIGGGALNLVQAPFSATVAGGYQNLNFGQDATIGGGSYNTINANDATIAGGTENRIGRTDFPGFGLYSVIGGGSLNRVVGPNATVAGGQDNQIDQSAEGAAIPGGFSAHAFNYGQHVFASGSTTTRGDAQSSLYVLRGNSTGSSTNDLFLDGPNASKRITVPVGSVWTLRIQVAAVYAYSLPTNQLQGFAAYEASGVVANLHTLINGGPAHTLIELHMVDGSGNPITTARPIFESATGGESTAAWQATPYVDTTDNTLRIAVRGDVDRFGFIGSNVKWTATIQTTEVVIP